MKFKDIYKLFLLAGVCALFAACGQQGQLYHPGADSPYGPPKYSPLHPNETTSRPQDKKAPAEKPATEKSKTDNPQPTTNNEEKTQ